MGNLGASVFFLEVYHALQLVLGLSLCTVRLRLGPIGNVLVGGFIDQHLEEVLVGPLVICASLHRVYESAHCTHRAFESTVH